MVGHRQPVAGVDGHEGGLALGGEAAVHGHQNRLVVHEAVQGVGVLRHEIPEPGRGSAGPLHGGQDAPRSVAHVLAIQIFQAQRVRAARQAVQEAKPRLRAAVALRRRGDPEPQPTARRGGGDLGHRRRGAVPPQSPSDVMAHRHDHGRTHDALLVAQHPPRIARLGPHAVGGPHRVGHHVAARRQLAADVQGTRVAELHGDPVGRRPLADHRLQGTHLGTGENAERLVPALVAGGGNQGGQRQGGGQEEASHSRLCFLSDNEDVLRGNGTTCQQAGHCTENCQGRRQAALVGGRTWRVGKVMGRTMGMPATRAAGVRSHSWTGGGVSHPSTRGG